MRFGLNAERLTCAPQPVADSPDRFHPAGGTEIVGQLFPKVSHMHFNGMFIGHGHKRCRGRLIPDPPHQVRSRLDKASAFHDGQQEVELCTGQVDRPAVDFRRPPALVHDQPVVLKTPCGEGFWPQRQ